MRKQTKYRIKQSKIPLISAGKLFQDNKGRLWQNKGEAQAASFINFMLGNLKNGFPIAVKYLWFPAKAFYPFIFLRYDALTTEIANHEMIHIRQQREMLIVFSYAWYATEFLIRLAYLFNIKKAYLTLSMERESRENQGNANYLHNRKPFAFLKYL